MKLCSQSVLFRPILIFMRNAPVVFSTDTSIRLFTSFQCFDSQAIIADPDGEYMRNSPVPFIFSGRLRFVPPDGHNVKLALVQRHRLDPPWPWLELNAIEIQEFRHPEHLVVFKGFQFVGFFYRIDPPCDTSKCWPMLFEPW